MGFFGPLNSRVIFRMILEVGMRVVKIVMLP